jgi:hypothetical protein
LPLGCRWDGTVAAAGTGQHENQWTYLDTIWNAINEADQLDPVVLPAATFRLARK